MFYYTGFVSTCQPAQLSCFLPRAVLLITTPDVSWEMHSDPTRLPWQSQADESLLADPIVWL